MAIDVFVSYHTATSLDIAKAVVQRLESQGLSCWYQDRDTRGAFGGVIKRAIEECGAFVVILNAKAARSRHVLNEVALAFDRDEVEILPIRMTQESLGDDMEYYLHRIHQIDGHSRSRDAVLEDLCRRTLRALGKSEIPVETIRYADGRVYVGQVVNGKRHGIGKLTWPSGSTYEGDWRDDKQNGKGKYTWGKDTKWAGDVYEGDFVDGKMHGKGQYTWGQSSQWAGDVYVGDWLNDGRTGTGTYTYADGRVESGRWKDGEFLG